MATFPAHHQRPRQPHRLTEAGITLTVTPLDRFLFISSHWSGCTTVKIDLHSVESSDDLEPRAANRPKRLDSSFGIHMTPRLSWARPTSSFGVAQPSPVIVKARRHDEAAIRCCRKRLGALRSVHRALRRLAAHDDQSFAALSARHSVEGCCFQDECRQLQSRRQSN